MYHAQQVNALERHLHLTLFRRTHRGLTLTKAGESLYRDAEFDHLPCVRRSLFGI